MRIPRGAVPALVLLAALAAGCRDANQARNNTAVLGGYGHPAPREATAPSLFDAQGKPIPPPPAGKAHAQVARTADAAATAVWIADEHVMASAWSPAAGWSAPQPLERIYGRSGEPELVANGQGSAMAVWHHQVGNIHSLRFSRFDGQAWSEPDVLPGALPRPPIAGAPPGHDAPQLTMDAQGGVVASWPSGFHANETQTARYTPGTGWSHAASESVASAQGASPASASASSAR